MSKALYSRKKFRYSKDFKVKAVKLSNQEGIQVQQVAEGLDIHPFMLSRWRKEYREGKLQGDNQKRVGVVKTQRTPSVAQLTENARLKKENERLKKENDLLKKWRRYLAEPLQNVLDSSSGSEKN